MREEDKILIAKFMGLEKVTVGYFKSIDETPWQTQNAEWMDGVELDSVGDYGVNVPKNVWFRWEDIKYDTWNWIMPVVEKIGEIKFGEDWKNNYSLSEVLQAITNKYYYRVDQPVLINTTDTLAMACTRWIEWWYELDKK